MIDLIDESWKCYVETKEEFEKAKRFLEEKGFRIGLTHDILRLGRESGGKLYLTNAPNIENMRICWNTENQGYTSSHSDATKQILGEEKMFDMKTQPWFIRINSQEEFGAVNEWLLDNHGASLECEWNEDCMVGLTNTTVSGYVDDEHIMWSCLDTIGNVGEEIKFSFKTVVDSVEFPEAVSEEKKEIERLTKIIEDAQKSLNKLKGE